MAKTCKAGGIQSPESTSLHELLPETNLKLSLIDIASCPLQGHAANQEHHQLFINCQFNPLPPFTCAVDLQKYPPATNTPSQTGRKKRKRGGKKKEDPPKAMKMNERKICLSKKCAHQSVLDRSARVLCQAIGTTKNKRYSCGLLGAPRTNNEQHLVTLEAAFCSESCISLWAFPGK